MMTFGLVAVPLLATLASAAPAHSESWPAQVLLALLSVVGGIMSFSLPIMVVGSGPIAAGLFLLWHHRIESNANALGLRPRSNAVTGALSWFIPAANLYLPFRRLFRVRRFYEQTKGPLGALWAAWWLAFFAYPILLTAGLGTLPLWAVPLSASLPLLTALVVQRFAALEGRTVESANAPPSPET